MRRRLLLGSSLLAVLSGCASAPPAPASAALRAICGGVADLRGQKTIAVVSQSQPVWMIAGLWVHYKDVPATAADVAELDKIEAALQSTFVPAPIDVPRDAACSFVPVAPRGGAYSDGTFVEVSPLIERGLAGNPTDGVMLRISAGGRPGASFYWVPLRDCATRCRADAPVSIDVSDG